MKFKILLILLFLTCTLSAQVEIEYQGIGVLKVEKGDKVLILPELAYVINPKIFQTGYDALAYVESNESDKLLVIYKNQVNDLKLANEAKDIRLTQCTIREEKLINDNLADVSNLQNIRKLQNLKIEKLENENLEMAKELKSQNIKSKVRSVVLVGVSGVAAWLGIQQLLE